ncbi:nucleolus and neural progenitor protein [Rhinophrynus dorsalis]
MSDPWNRVHIPRPAIQSLVTIPLGADTEKNIKDVVEKCFSVKKSLISKALDAEKAALHSILYVYHHRLCYHKPYLALKQVEQCLKRLKDMDLQASIQEMLDLCPACIGEGELPVTQHCSVPSQPIIEVVSVKILGACKLLLRLMDCCCKAFQLCLQHLYLEEFIVMNVVLLGLLSRLWVLHRGILKKLISLYVVQFSLQQEVSKFQNMPYIKDFIFPSKIEDYLGSVFTDLVKQKLPQIASKKGAPLLLNTIFSTRVNGKDKLMVKTRIAKSPEARTNAVDLGQPIEAHGINRGTLGTFNVKALCHPLKPHTRQVCSSKQKSNSSKIRNHHRRNMRCVAHIVPKIQQAESFRELSEQLQHAVKWCKRRKLTWETLFFRNKSLKSNRLKHVEALGCSLKRKLQCLKKSICHTLHQGTLRAKHPPMPGFRIKHFQQTSKHKVTLSRKNKLQSPWKRHIIYSAHCEPRAERSNLKRTELHLDMNLGTQEGSSTVTDILTPCELETKKSSSRSVNTDPKIIKDDIDDIFSSIGL